MSNTLVIEITNPKAKDLLQQLEDLHWIKVLEDPTLRIPASSKRNFRGVITKEQGKKLQTHIETIRNEWGDI